MTLTLLKNCTTPFKSLESFRESNNSASINRGESILIKNGFIEAIGLEDEVLAHVNSLTGDETYETIDLKGMTVLPGFNDSHMHLLGYGQSLYNCLLTEANSPEHLVILVKEWLNTHPLLPGQWIQGRGWNQDHFDTPTLPTRDLLDQISTEHPIMLSRACGHLVAVNSKALEIAGISEATDLSKIVLTDGSIDVDLAGRPTGILRENAKALVSKQMPLPDKDQLKEYILTAQEALLKEGLTSVQSDDLCVYPMSMNTLVFEAFKELASERSLKMSVYEQSLFETTENLKMHLENGYTYNEDFVTFRTGPLKILGDGSLGGRTALLSSPYADDPEVSGIALYTQTELNELVGTAAKASLPAVIHAIGDGMLDMALESLAVAHTTELGLRSGIVHCQVTRPEQLNRMADLKLHALVQPIFLDYDLHMAEERLGASRVSSTYAFKTMIEKNIPAPYGTDCPVETPSVWKCIQCAVTRKDLKNIPDGGWLPHEAVSLPEALCAYTELGAWASGEEGVKGKLLPGYRADLVVVNQNPFESSPERLQTIETQITFCPGELL